jgi:polyisoprenoid-binding protein YceI
MIFYEMSWIKQSIRMKNKLFSIFPIGAVAMAFLISSCNQAPRGDEATITEKQEAVEATGTSYAVDTAESVVKFTGHGVGKNHPGNFKLASGHVHVKNNEVTGGDFVIDIKSLDMDQREQMFQEKLKPHLLSGDFLDVDKFGTAKFEITKIEPYKANQEDSSIVDGANFHISGNLTLKDVTKNITFPARIELNHNTLRGLANFDIDRRDWQINYGNDKTLGDKFISETVNIELDLKAKK